MFSLIIAFFWFFIIFCFIVNFSYEGMENLRLQMKIIQNCNMVIVLTFVLGFITSSIIDISKFVDRKLFKIKESGD